MIILHGLPSHIYIFAAILAVLLLSFVIFSLLPSFVVSRQLSVVIKKLKMLDGAPGAGMSAIFARKGVLEHLWQEYADSLHKQTDGGISVRLRSTMPAGVVFRPDILVDIPLHTDFFKHLPGLFTGVGIIGTFYGLLIGMKSFVVSENPIVVRESLTRLLHGVSEAFLISASAITLAMIVTFIEKLVVSRLNAKVEKLVQLLDGLFEGGAGEEYLARLVQASEAASAQTAGLLKGELKQILAELFEKQMRATDAGSVALGDRIAQSIEGGMRAPLSEIAVALKNSDQGAALRATLDDFGMQMKALLGAQNGGGQQLEALAAIRAQLERMATAADAGQRSMESMAGQFEKSSAEAASRDALMREKLDEFIAQMRQDTNRNQTEGQAQLQNALDAMFARVAKVLDGLDNQVRAVSDAGLHHQQALQAQNQQMAGLFSEQVAAMAAGVGLAVEQIKTAVAVMHDTTTAAMAGLNTSADTLHQASQEFSRAAQHVSETLDKSSGVADKLVQAADTVAAASTGLGVLFDDYQASREAMLAQMSTLQMLAEQVRRDASMSGEVLGRIEAATAKLIAAQRDADEYLSKISDVIGVAHQSFSEGMTRAVGEANRDFHQALSDSVKLLREGIHELESTLDAATSI
jgi:hypothetical protein